MSENERNELGVAAMQAAKALPQIPADKIGKYGAVAGFGFMAITIVQARVDEDQRLRSQPNPALRPAPRPAPASAIEQLPPDVAQLVREGKAEIVSMTPQEYAEMMRERNGDDAYPTLGATHETLLDEIIGATQGVDQGTLAEHARASGRLEGN